MQARLLLAQESPVSTVIICAPGRESVTLHVELIREIDIRFAIEQVPQIQTRPFQMYRVDLKIAPIERAVGVVMVDLALALRIFGPLYRESNAASRAKLPACVLLIGSQRMPLLIELSFKCIGCFRALRNYERPLKMQPHRRLQTERVLRVNLNGHPYKQHARKQGKSADRQIRFRGRGAHRFALYCFFRCASRPLWLRVTRSAFGQRSRHSLPVYRTPT